MARQTTNIECGVQVSMAIMSALGTLLLGLGQDSVFLPCIAIMAAVASLIITDTLSRFQLQNHLANLAALLAVCYSMSDVLFGGQDSQTHLVAVANLLVYLQVVLQFQKKNLRIYWSLSVLSLLQVVVASALHLSVSFAPLIFVYLIVGLTSMSLLFIHRETLRFRTAMAAESLTNAAMLGRRWPLADTEADFSSVVSEDVVRPLIGWRMARHVVAMGLLTFFVTTMLFFGIPRYNRRAWRAPNSRGARATGFTEQVSLGEMGRILQSDAPVMRVVFQDSATAQPFRVSGDLYLRGATLTEYEHGRWTHSSQEERVAWWVESLPSRRNGEGSVIQSITLNSPVRSSLAARYSILFSTYPVYQHEQSPYVLEVDRQRRQLVLDNTALPPVVRQLSYSVRSGAFTQTAQAQFTREPNTLGFQTIARLELDELASLTKLIAQADEIVRSANATTSLQKALEIEAHFHTPGLYTYSLDPDVVRTPDIDPIEDFVANHRTGHCEYFASAMVLMLRSQGVPARMVVGYASGEWNAVGNYYQFLERNAHAWVEVYLEPGQFPHAQMAESDLASHNEGAWMRLDPTPADNGADAELGDEGLFAQARDAFDCIQILWDDYVLGLNSETQQNSIYRPVVATVTGVLCWVRENRRWLAFLLVIAPMAVVGFALCGFVWWSQRQPALAEGGSLRRLLTAPPNWFAQWFVKPSELRKKQYGPLVPFYQRLARLLSALGYHRESGQTQMEFALATGGALADQPQFQSVAGVPRRIVNAFYQVRFGRRALCADELSSVESSLQELEAAIARAKALSPPKTDSPPEADR